MIAEIHSKISSSGSNLSDRLEDKLTGDFFGNLRYLSYEKGLKLILDEVIFYKGNSDAILEETNKIIEQFIGDKLDFWPKCKNTGTELDLSISFDNLFIGVEVKYRSPLSGDNQLLRELKVINGKRNKRKKLLLFISQGDGLTEAIQAIDSLGKDSYLLDDIAFAYITWEDIYEVFKGLNLDSYNNYEKIVMQDIIRLLKFKGFEKFRDFILDEKYSIQDMFFEFDYNLLEDFNFKFDIKIEEAFYEFR